ncbi:hypothetical protein NDU88_000878 [Pleurodeles waltl]|uniref:Coiled-coil domain-containing protein 89 n=1 Tax=Pleurodeles waltl TaxID=8319 RepID=A0AAV7S953_PLEWA|nr:hypothetical protein NDU88_000878 [Pleurodeles waltl]
MGDLKGTLQKLHSLTLDDKTENAMLRSRIDEQSQLICALKRRADETLLRCQALEAINTELEASQEDAAGQLKLEGRRAELLERRFTELASNHQHMIRFKDDYKAQNEELRQENTKLRQENKALFSDALQEKDDKIHELGKDVDRLVKESALLKKELSDKMADLQTREEDFLEKQRQKELSHSQELQAVNVELQRALQESQQAKAHLRSVEKAFSSAEGQLEALNAEKQELLQLSMQRGKVIQEKQRELAQLEEQLRAAEQGRRGAEERYHRGLAELDANLKVQTLRTQLDESEEHLQSLQKEFEAFKKHSADLLAKERELNAKLRHLIG